MRGNLHSQISSFVVLFKFFKVNFKTFTFNITEDDTFPIPNNDQNNIHKSLKMYL